MKKKQMVQENLLDHEAVVDVIRWAFQERAGIDFTGFGDPFCITEEEAEQMLTMVPNETLDNRDRLGILLQAFKEIGDKLSEEAKELLYADQNEVVDRTKERINQIIKREQSYRDRRKLEREQIREQRRTHVECTNLITVAG